MAKKTVHFKVEGKDGVKAFWIAVGNHDVPLVNGEGDAQVEAGVDQMLVWWFLGEPGAKLSIVGKVDLATVVQVKESTIPDDRHQGAGAKRFKV